ncbi:response regulator [Bacillus songklensis]|uniref:Response regulator n=1 Tax=Bacillus songklensis TaxID=1069116 RepID=A0ABV8B231_9BACI
MNKQEWNVLLIEDDPMVQEVNRQFIEQVEGFNIIGYASDGVEGMELIRKYNPDLAIMDMYMPNQDGLTTLQQIRSEGYTTDIIAVTAASDMETVRRVLQHGAIDYIMKPFKFERIKHALENYRTFRTQIKQKENVTQTELDRILFQKHEEKLHSLPKGLNALTLKNIQHYLAKQSTPISAEEVAEGVGIARVTARRYLEFLEQDNQVKLHIEYGGVGRPVNRYMLVERR